MPLIRYQLDDSAEYEFDYYRITGHREGIVYGLNGEMISLAALNLHSDKINRIACFQLYQEQRGELLVKVVPIHQLSPMDIEDLRVAFQKQAGNGLKVEIEVVGEIPLSSRGKYKLLIQNIK